MNRALLAVLLAAASRLFGAYTYYLTDPLTSINTANWYVNGTATATTGGVTSDQGTSGSLISKVAGGSDYEVKSTVVLAPYGGTPGFFHYLRASSDANRYPSEAGSFYSVEAGSFSYSQAHQTYTATLKVHKRVGGVLTQLAATTIGFPAVSEIRSIIRGSRIDVWVNGIWYLSVTDSSLASGQPGVGIRYSYTSVVSSVSLGALDTTAPGAVNAQGIATYALPNSVDMQWQGADDGANGIGVAHYLIYRDGVFLQESPSAEFTDDTVSPSTTYTYGIIARDFHLNDSSQTTFQVTTPPADAIEPRRVGVRPLGSYWGAGGEQIDMLSGNLNFSLPLASAMGRNGASLAFRLSYNSQLWRKDPAATWKLGRDIGFGYGWRFQVGSITPYWEGPFTIHHYTFIDSTGAEYRLDQPDANNEKWTSREGIYLTYDRVTQRLYFPDGSFWYMGCVSAGTEQDAGTRYPTVIQDSNGNQILLSYKNGVGTAWDNSSARIWRVDDVRSVLNNGVYWTYRMNYNTDSLPHLTSVYSYIGTPGYEIYYTSSQTLYSPFTPQATFGTTRFLDSVVQSATGLKHEFDYNSSGEMSRLTFPYGGSLEWLYRDFTYLGNRTIREVYRRNLTATPGGPSTAHLIWRHDEVDAGGSLHYLTVLWDWDDATGTHSHKTWTFSNTPGVWYTGLLQKYQEGPAAWEITTRQQEYTWTQTTSNNPYISAVVTTLDPGQSYERVSKTEQTLDAYGNVTQSKVYNYGDLTTPVRTYNNTYLTGTNYANRNIFNRLLTSTLTGGGNQITLVSNTYDGAVAWGAQDARNHDPAYDPYYTYRGNVTQRAANGVTTTLQYDATGTVINATDGQGHSVAVTTGSTYNYAVPTAITPNNQSSLTTNLVYNGALALLAEQRPNDNDTFFTYDYSNRPFSTTSPFGAVTYYTYNDSERWTKATTNNRWTKTTTDGLGRTVRVETGYDTTTVSIVDTEYDVCACSPMGKVKRVSQPYAPGETVYWTTYAYDCLGRTTSVTQPGNSGTTTYVYQGNTVTVTDPKGAWKKYTLDVLGNLVQVTEQGPGSSPNHETYYTYNLRNQLIGVSMPRSGVTQARTFNYDLTTGRLSSVTNPETGTTSYTYNADGSVATRTDAKNQRVEYTYDSLGRVTQIRRYNSSGVEQACERMNLYYDETPSSFMLGAYTQNGLGRLAAAEWGDLSSCTSGRFRQLYSYHSGGAATKKRQLADKTWNWNRDMEAVYTYNSMGQLVSTQYPSSGPTFTYTYDPMGRPVKLTDNRATPVDWVKDVVYNAAGQITEMKSVHNLDYPDSPVYRNEHRTYNVLGQVTHMHVDNQSNVLNRTYTYSATQNDGRIETMVDAVSGETVQYQYDSLKRLISAQTTGTQWGQSFTYDGFGNLLAQTVTKGTAPSLSVLVSGTTNRISSAGYSYDANGNLTAAPGLAMSYDIENRMVSATSSTGTEYYSYGPSNERVWKRIEYPGGFGINFFYFYGVDGALLTTNGIDEDWDYNVYFAGRQVWRENTQFNWSMPPMPVSPDRLGSTVKHFPYGDEPTTTAPNREKFATYYRDEVTALDYARNRYYSSTIARFTTADPYAGSANPNDPSSWNRYSYVGSDPANGVDPDGLCTVMIAGITQGPSAHSAFTGAAIGMEANSVYPYQGQNMVASVLSVMDQAGGPNAATQAALQAIRYSLATNSGSIDVVAYSGGAAAFTAAFGQLTADEQSRVGLVLYLSPGALGPVTAASGNTSAVFGMGVADIAATVGTEVPDGVPMSQAHCSHKDFACLMNAAASVVDQMAQNGPCSDPKVFTRLAPNGTPGYGLPAPGGGGGHSGEGSFNNYVWWQPVFWGPEGASYGVGGWMIGTEPRPRLMKLW